MTPLFAENPATKLINRVGRGPEPLIGFFSARVVEIRTLSLFAGWKFALVCGVGGLVFMGDRRQTLAAGKFGHSGHLNIDLMNHCGFGFPQV